MMTIAAGTKLGRYEIRSKLGEGGMGEVYRARDEKLNRDVAIKVLPAALSHDSDRLRRFEQEAQAAGALNHPNILAVYDVGMHDGSPYIVSELLAGEELREQLNDGSLPQRKALDYAQQIAQGLAAAHERGITHRDLKPENLFVTTDGRVKILDFGLAKLRPLRNESVSSEIDTRKQITDPGTVMGTVGYMSPEQVRGHEADHRSDIFSFGSILYEMLAGQRAFRRDTMAETMTAILTEEPPEMRDSNKKISLPL
jgi:serine/threonine protein kinase